MKLYEFDDEMSNFIFEKCVYNIHLSIFRISFVIRVYFETFGFFTETACNLFLGAKV